MENIGLSLSEEEQAQPEASLWRVLDSCGIPFRGPMKDIFAGTGQGVDVGEGTVSLADARSLIPSLTIPLELGCIERDWFNAHREWPLSRRALDVIDPMAPLRKICGRVIPDADPEQAFARIVNELSDLLGPANGPGGFNWEIGGAKVGVQNVHGSLNASPHVILSIVPGWRQPASDEERRALSTPCVPIAPDERLRVWRQVDRFDRMTMPEQPQPGVWATENLDYVVEADRQNRLRIIPAGLIKRVTGHYLKKAKGAGCLYTCLEIETGDGEMRLPVYDLFWDSERLDEIEQAGRDIAAMLSLPFSSNIHNILFDG